ncbi:MAG: hypothetical protein COZ31_01625 [Nitrospirae bacterium CG_4_10_14_3_um_filter_44_29]|nr:4Fe-4S binding protein [Nitrospirota bacterium]OIO32063.1 MAG: hypothetical protein AUJ60_00410 [Nitrospirae bacterium CG1_02_44_142]PIP70025.1 MAG: hypothetical protein COW90_07525 [Nitrospirae bacterium CG22_combo_CG10-13_8_21_14_all_44_11]PIV44025.1 MAG: hypothetical protein COS28_01205 [Nitrospirae bacterium CG02_land_8_20_14_3_00_44_33]PIV66898.1 MAG: hypothetical protein COS10_03835 [Nitrospirae bacterium CG01_land_8_20_14_3_00_44_22]PIW89406.1 MAG: hypothetical protein COZ93_05165 [N
MRIRVLRRIAQILTVFLIIAIPVLNKKGVTLITGTLYSLSVDGIWITDPLSGFQVIISSFSADRILLLSMVIPAALALAFGRVFCGWMCPQNAISEFFDYISRKIPPLPPFSKGGMGGFQIFNITPSAKPRYVIMFLLLVSAPLLGFPVANLISAPGIISVQVSKYFYEGIVGLELGLIGIIVISEVFIIRRGWCNYICPVGSFLGIFRFKRTMKVIYTEDSEHTCGGCMECVTACQLGLNPMEGRIYPLCHNCGDCIDICEKIKSRGKPLSFKF